MKKRYLAIIVSIFLVLFLGYNYVYKSHRNIRSENAFYHVDSSTFIQEFSTDIEISTEKYLNEVIEITGFVTKVDDYVLEIDKKINCYFDKTTPNFKLLQKKIIVKGRCIGFDELFGEIKIDQGTVIKIY